VPLGTGCRVNFTNRWGIGYRASLLEEMTAFVIAAEIIIDDVVKACSSFSIPIEFHILGRLLV